MDEPTASPTGVELVDAMQRLEAETGDHFAEHVFIGALAQTLAQRGQQDAWLTALETTRQICTGQRRCVQ